MSDRDERAPVTLWLSNDHTASPVLDVMCQRWCYGITDARTGKCGWRLCSILRWDEGASGKLLSYPQLNREHGAAGKATVTVTVLRVDTYPLALWTVVGMQVSPELRDDDSGPVVLPDAAGLGAAIQDWACRTFGQTATDTAAIVTATAPDERDAAASSSIPPLRNIDGSDILDIPLGGHK
jgi:hypothetical protein